MAPEKIRSERFHLVLTKEERGMLRALADATGLNESQAMRTALREKHGRMTEAKK